MFLFSRKLPYERDVFCLKLHFYLSTYFLIRINFIFRRFLAQLNWIFISSLAQIRGNWMKIIFVSTSTLNYFANNNFLTKIIVEWICVDEFITYSIFFFFSYSYLQFYSILIHFFVVFMKNQINKWKIKFETTVFPIFIKLIRIFWFLWQKS